MIKKFDHIDILLQRDMKIERINENSISCTLSSFDLSVRNLNLRELAYGSEKARKLFEEMMMKADAEVGFRVENTPLMIEAIPMSSDSIKLIISKVMDPDELDARFSRFTKGSQNEKKSDNLWFSKLASILLEGAENQMRESDSRSEGRAKNDKIRVLDSSDKGKTNSSVPKDNLVDVSDAKKSAVKSPVLRRQDMIFRAFSFDDLDIVISAAKATSYFAGESILYKDPDSGIFVLALKTYSSTDEEFVRACNTLSEYGSMTKTAPHMDLYFEEHYFPMIKQNAIEKLARI